MNLPLDVRIMPIMTMRHDWSLLRVIGLLSFLFKIFCMIRVNIGPAVAIVCKIPNGRKNCAAATTKPSKMKAKCLLMSVFHVFLL